MKCDVCGGELEMLLGGKKAKCQVCGMTYSLDTLKDKFQNNTNTSELKIRIHSAKNMLFSKNCVVIGTVESGNVRTRDILCVEGIHHPSFKVVYARQNDHSREVRIQLENVPKKTLNKGQVLIHSMEVDHYFESILYQYFKNYDIRKDVHIIDGGVDVNFLVLKDGQPKLAIILCNSRVYNSKEIQNTMNILEESGIVVQRYFRDFENKRDYVRNRMSSVL